MEGSTVMVFVKPYIILQKEQQGDKIIISLLLIFFYFNLLPISTEYTFGKNFSPKLHTK